MSSAASAVIHSVRLISSGVDRADAFVAFEDDRVLATGPAAAGVISSKTTRMFSTARGRFSPRDCSTSTTTVVPAPHTTKPATPSVRLGDSTASTALLVSCSLVTASPDTLISQIQIAAAEARRDPRFLGSTSKAHSRPPYCGAHNPAPSSRPRSRPG